MDSRTRSLSRQLEHNLSPPISLMNPQHSFMPKRSRCVMLWKINHDSRFFWSINTTKSQAASYQQWQAHLMLCLPSRIFKCACLADIYKAFISILMHCMHNTRIHPSIDTISTATFIFWQPSTTTASASFGGPSLGTKSTRDYIHHVQRQN